MKRENQIRKGHSYAVIENGKNPVRFDSNIQRNDPCHCGSGHKFKKCCMAKRDAQFAIDPGKIKAVINLTKVEVMKMLVSRQSLRFTHDSFLSGEYIFVDPDKFVNNKGDEKDYYLVDEKGVALNFKEFFTTRTGEQWANGWRIYKEDLK